MTTMTVTTSTLNVRMSTTTKDALEALAQATGRSKNHHVIEAIERYLAEQSWQIAEIQAGIADLDAGRSVPQAQVAAEVRQIIDDARRAQAS